MSKYDMKYSILINNGNFFIYCNIIIKSSYINNKLLSDSSIYSNILNYFLSVHIY